MNALSQFLFDKRHITIAIMFVASFGTIVHAATWTIQTLKFAALAIRGKVFPFKTTLKPIAREKTVMNEWKSPIVGKPRFENIREIKADEQDGLAVGQINVKYCNMETGDVYSIKLQLIYKKNDRFGDIFIYKDADTEKIECVFIEGCNKDSVLVNIVDYTVFVTEFELELENFMDKVVWTAEMMFYPILFGYFVVTMWLLDIMVK